MVEGDFSCTQPSTHSSIQFMLHEWKSLHMKCQRRLKQWQYHDEEIGDMERSGDKKKLQQQNKLYFILGLGSWWHNRTLDNITFLPFEFSVQKIPRQSLTSANSFIHPHVFLLPLSYNVVVGFFFSFVGIASYTPLCIDIVLCLMSVFFYVLILLLSFQENQ